MSHKSSHSSQKQSSKKKGMHQDWRTWTIVILMLAGMAAYILTDNEVIVPAEQPQTPVEAM